jgi:hypothetical protein
MKKRAYERIPVDLKADFFWSDQLNIAAVADLSENGLLVKTDVCPPLRAKFDLNLPVEGDVLKIPVKVCRLVENDQDTEAIGVEILHPSEEYLNFVSTLRWNQIKGQRQFDPAHQRRSV